MIESKVIDTADLRGVIPAAENGSRIEIAIPMSVVAEDKHDCQIHLDDGIMGASYSIWYHDGLVQNRLLPCGTADQQIERIVGLVTQISGARIHAKWRSNGVTAPVFTETEVTE